VLSRSQDIGARNQEPGTRNRKHLRRPSIHQLTTVSRQQLSVVRATLRPGGQLSAEVRVELGVEGHRGQQNGTTGAAGAGAGEDWAARRVACRRQNAWRTTWTGCAAEHIPREHHPALQLAA